MFFDDHNPPHFHARYGKDTAAIEISSLRVLEGQFPPRALGLVVERAPQHKKELLKNWDLVKNNGSSGNPVVRGLKKGRR